MKIRKNFVSGIVLAAIIILYAAPVVRAASIEFYSRFVDSNQWTYICQEVKETTTSSVDVYISALYKADGSSSNYQYVKECACLGTSCTIALGYVETLPLSSVHQSAGSHIQLYLKGNNPALDCKASGTFIVH